MVSRSQENRYIKVKKTLASIIHLLPGGIVEIPLLLAIDRTAPAHEMIQPVVLQGAGDAITDLAGRVAPTVIAAHVIDRALARTCWGRGRLG